MTTLTAAATHDALSDADYRDIYDELRAGHALRGFIEVAGSTLSGYGLPKPAGMEDDHGAGVGYALRGRQMKDGRIRYRLTFKRANGRHVQIGYWFTKPFGPVDGRIVKINRGTELERRVRVRLDNLGLPCRLEPVYP